MNDIWFWSDTHFGEKVHLEKFDMRPYKTVEEMDEALIENHNNLVKPTDFSFHLGDFSSYGPDKTREIISRLNGNKTLILGNHDRVIKNSGKLKGMFGCVKEYSHELNALKHKFILSHFPIGEWHHAYRGAIHLHGHTHGKYRHAGEGKIMDVSVKCLNYRPIHIEEVLEFMKDRPCIGHQDVVQEPRDIS